MVQNDRRSGIQGFECNVDAFDKNTFHFWEIYESFVAMNDIRASPEHTKFVMDVCFASLLVLCHSCLPGSTDFTGYVLVY